MSKLAAIFPGQGAQAPGMGKDLYADYSVCKSLFDRANDVLGYDLAKNCFEGPQEVLTRSDRAQPAIFTVSACVLEALRSEADFKPDMTAGLSSGEYAALYAAGVLSFDDTLRILDARGKYMQEACEARAGGMLSVMGLSLEDLEAVCDATGLELANLNSPVQTVLSGPAEYLDQAEALAKEKGAKRALKLNVAGAFHCSLMQPAADRMADLLAGIEFKNPEIPVIANVTGEPHGDADAIRSRMVEQVTGSVQWVQSVETMKSAGVSEYVECGPGKVLTGLVKRIDKSAGLSNISDSAGIKARLEA